MVMIIHFSCSFLKKNLLCYLRLFYRKIIFGKNEVSVFLKRNISWIFTVTYADYNKKCSLTKPTQVNLFLKRFTFIVDTSLGIETTRTLQRTRNIWK